MREEKKEHSSQAGRMYAYTGGVSEAVGEAVKQLRPEGEIQVRARQADGVPACRDMLSELSEKKTDANFFEGMGCVGGCVGGPKAVMAREQGRSFVQEYAEKANYRTPLENPFVMKLMEELGFETVDELLEEEQLFVRHF